MYVLFLFFHLLLSARCLCSADCAADDSAPALEMWEIMTTKRSHLACSKDDVFGCSKNDFFHAYGLMTLSLLCVSYTQLFEFLGPEGFEMISTLLQKRSDVVDSLLSAPLDSRVSYPPGESCNVFTSEQQERLQSDASAIPCLDNDLTGAFILKV